MFIKLRETLFAVLLLVPSSLFACGVADPYPFVRVAAGWTGNFATSESLDNEGALAAQFELGMRFPLTTTWQLDAKYGHDSWWFAPDDGDESRDHVNIGLEYQFR